MGQLSTFSNVWRHFKKICVHKYYVGKFCFQAGLYWQGIVHDLSKFSPTEFNESVKYYQGDVSPIVACKKENGYSMAWFHHRGRNLHHYECWVDNFDNYFSGDKLTLIRMPYKYALELICDYLGAGMAYMGKDFSFEKEWQWWLNKRENCAMHPYTKSFVDTVLYWMKKDGDADILKDSLRLRAIYHADIDTLREEFGNNVCR